MQFSGFQKLTVLDFPGKVACILFTAGCNFRCPFCHNASLVTHIDPARRIEESEVLSFLKKRAGLLEGVCVTGGEPLLCEGLPSFLAAVKELGYAVKLDTNGSFPQRLIDLVRAGLVDYVAMDIKNSKARYAETVGVAGVRLCDVEASVEFLLRGEVPYEFRTTVVRELHTCEDIRALSEWIAGARAYYLQGFVDSGDLISGGLHAVDAEELDRMRQAASKAVPSVLIRGL